MRSGSNTTDKCLNKSIGYLCVIKSSKSIHLALNSIQREKERNTQLVWLEMIWDCQKTNKLKSNLYGAYLRIWICLLQLFFFYLFIFFNVWYSHLKIILICVRFLWFSHRYLFIYSVLFVFTSVVWNILLFPFTRQR